MPQKARIICPYFKRLSKEGRVIVCEGFEKNTEIAVLFRTKKDMEIYSEKTCETYRYGRCCVARIAAEKYTPPEA